MKTIRGKIMSLVLAISLLSLLVMAIVTGSNLYKLQHNLLDMSVQLGEIVGMDTAATLEDQIKWQLFQTVQDNATIIDERFKQQQTYTAMAADYLTTVYSNPELYTPMVVLPPDPALAGTNMPQLVFAPDADQQALGYEVGQLANAADVFLLMKENNPHLDSNFYSSESGINILIDDAPQNKPATIDVRQRSWYRQAVEAKGLIWTDIFDDKFGKGLSIACAAPFFDERSGEIKGVAGFQFLISTMSQGIVNDKIGETEYTFIVNDQAETVVSSTIERGKNGEIVRESLLDSSSELVRQVGSDVLEGRSGVTSANLDGQKIFMAYQRMEALPWTVITVVNMDEALEPAYLSRDNVAAFTSNITRQTVDGAVRFALIAIVVIFCATVILVVVGGGFLARRLTRPLAELTAGVEQISAGDLDVQLQVSTRDEIGVLANRFNAMTDNLKTHIKELTTVTAEKERIGAELNVAKDIQASMLPSIFPAFPDRKEFDIYASMHPAKEVGGDFYDFFLVDENHLGMVIADVSGKGVPAALFMVIAKTLMKNHAQNGELPHELLENVNNQLCENNETAMFVTAWVGVLDVRNGELTFANAGHTPPVLKRANGVFEPIAVDTGFVVAGFEGMTYRQDSIQLQKGDLLYLYTDGATDAINSNEELFGEERLMQTLNAQSDQSLQELLVSIKREIDCFAGDTPQFDDITMLVIRFLGNER